MSNAKNALLNRSSVPTLEALNDALRQLKFKLAVDESYIPMQSSGYLPCTINGEDGGLDLRFDAAEPYLAQFPNLREQAGGHDTLIVLRSGGDPREDVCVSMLAAVLAEKFDAIVHDPKKNTLLAAAQLISQARSQFAELD